VELLKTEVLRIRYENTCRTDCCDNYRRPIADAGDNFFIAV